MRLWTLNKQSAKKSLSLFCKLQLAMKSVLTNFWEYKKNKGLFSFIICGASWWNVVRITSFSVRPLFFGSSACCRRITSHHDIAILLPSSKRDRLLVVNHPLSHGIGGLEMGQTRHNIFIFYFPVVFAFSRPFPGKKCNSRESQFTAHVRSIE